MIGVYIVIGIVAVLLIAFAVIYNRLVNMHNQMKNRWAQVDVQLKRRHDLIPNLVETVKGYRDFERGTLEAVTQARTAAQAASNAAPAARAGAEGQLTGALTRLMAVVENYPDLKANQSFLSLQQQLAETENNISTARRAYNEMVMMCNNLNQQFPSNIVAHIAGFHDGEFFEVKAEAERAAPQVGFK